MVSTRSTPQGDFPSFESSPSKKTSRTSFASPAPTGTRDLIGLNASPPTFRSATRRVASSVRDTAYTARDKAADTVAAVSPPAPAEIGEEGWCHTASNLTVLWLFISIPLVLWDVLYILLRPHTFAGGALQWPIWKPYELYASVDKVYSRSAWDANEGFGGAQGVLNAVELVLYGLYAMILYNHGTKAPSGTGLQAGQGVSAWFAGGLKVQGKVGNRALIIGFAAAVMTLSKTVLYYFNEYFSNFNSIRHNDWFWIVLIYGILNGLWVIFPAYMTVVFGSDIVHALDIATEFTSTKKN